MQYHIGQKVQTGLAQDWLGDFTTKVIIVGELKDGRILCEPMPKEMITISGKKVYYSRDDGLILRNEVKNIKEEVL